MNSNNAYREGAADALAWVLWAIGEKREEALQQLRGDLVARIDLIQTRIGTQPEEVAERGRKLRETAE